MIKIEKYSLAWFLRLMLIVGCLGFLAGAAHLLNVFGTNPTGPTVDAKVSGVNQVNNTPINLLLTTTKTNEIIIVQTNQNVCVTPSCSISSNPVLAWTVRANETYLFAGNGVSIEYFAYAANPKTYNITVAGGTLPAAIAVSFSNIVFNNAFDGNPGLANKANGSGTTFSASLTTFNSPDFLIAMGGQVGSGCTLSGNPNPPFAIVLTLNIATCMGFFGGIVGNTQSGLTNEVTSNSNGQWTIIVDALKGLIVPNTEPQTVLFRDDFLYTNNLLESSWTIDAYTNPLANSGIYTSTGYAIMKATTTGSESIHVTSPIFNPALYDNNTQVKRKMTVALLPFTIKESDTANIRAGLGPLLSTGAYPGSGPYGVPSIDGTNNCAQSANAPDNIGIEYLAVHNDGTVVMATCGDGSSNKVNLETGVDVTKYSVLTVETSGVFCSTCTDNVLNGTAWVFFRFYQEDTTGKIIGSTDKNHNFTSNIAPLAGTNYATVFQQNNNAGATSQTSKVDFVQVQNYGSPVCLIAPTGQLCTKLPFNPGHLTSDVIGTFAYIASLLGGGDEQAGAIVLFLILSAGFAGAPLLITRSLTWGLFGEESVVGFFVYAGFLPAWILFLLILGAAVIVVMMVNKLVSGHGMGGGDMG